MNSPSLQIHSTVPVICRDDIQRSVSYYTKVRGFQPDFEFGEPVAYAGVRSGDAEIYFSYDPDFVSAIIEKKISPEVFIWLTDADGSFKQHVANGAEITETISDRPWGARQYVIKDVNGYYLKFAQPL